MQPRRNKPRDVGDVHHHQRAHLVADGADAREVEDAGISACARDDHLGLAFEGDALHLVIVDGLRLLGDAVGNDVEKGARKVDGRAVRQMSAVREVHPHDGIAGLEHGEIDGKVRLRARMRLHVGMFAAEQLLEPVARKVLHDVHVLAAAVIALSGIPFRILVGEVAPHRRHDGRRNDVLAGDEFEIAALTGKLLFHRLADFGVGVSDSGKIDHVTAPYRFLLRIL